MIRLIRLIAFMAGLLILQFAITLSFNCFTLDILPASVLRLGVLCFLIATYLFSLSKSLRTRKVDVNWPLVITAFLISYCFGFTPASMYELNYLTALLQEYGEVNILIVTALPSSYFYFGLEEVSSVIIYIRNIMYIAASLIAAITFTEGRPKNADNDV